MMRSLQESQISRWNIHLESLSVQKKLLDIIPLESVSHVWSRIMTSLPAGQLSFIIRAGIDCLPTPMTLYRWRYRTDSSCNLCKSPYCTVNHILNGCPTSLSQGRYTWRHDSVLRNLFQFLRSNLDTSVSIFADLNGMRAADTPPSTIPLNVLVTTARPDIVVIDDNHIYLLELTIPCNTVTNLGNARERKQQKENYIFLINDLSAKGYFAELENIEIGSLGHFSQYSIDSVHHILPQLSKKTISKNLISMLSTVAISCSYTIFKCHNSLDWLSPT